MYQRVLPDDFVTEALAEQQREQNNRIYSARVVMWLMMQQRLQGNASMRTAVLEVVRGLPMSFWPQPCRRLREGRVSSRDASYDTARQELPLRVVEQCCDRMLEQLSAVMHGEVAAAPGRRAFFFDGTTVRTPHTQELEELYPPGANQHGESHWPILRMLVAHDLETGLAMRPEWGAMHGAAAVSEQGC